MHAPGAPIFLIGTFKDAVPKEQQHDKINEVLCIKLKLNVVAPTLIKNTKNNLVFWPIDNSKGALGDITIQELRESIMDTACGMKHIEMQVPLAWTRIYDKLMETKKRNLTISDVIEISKKYQIDSMEQASAMLSFFHQLGMILHFNKTEELRDLVILEPQWLVDALTMVIRDFELHPYEKILKNDLLMNLAEDFVNLKENSIVSINLLNRLWKGEDNNPNVDFTRRKFLISIMEQMTLSCPWRYNEENDDEIESEEKDIFKSLPPATKFLIPSNLRLFRPPEIEGKLKSQMNKKIPTFFLSPDGVFESSGKNKYPDAFAIDFSLSFLPIGFFDRLACLLVAFSSLCFKDSRVPIVASCSVLMSFGTNDFRVDELIDQHRIMVTMAKESDCQLVVQNIESMVSKLKDEVMGSQLKYKILVNVWNDDECSLVDIEKAREAVEKKTNKNS